MSSSNSSLRWLAAALLSVLPACNLAYNVHRETRTEPHPRAPSYGKPTLELAMDGASLRVNATRAKTVVVDLVEVVEETSSHYRYLNAKTVVRDLLVVPFLPIEFITALGAGQGEDEGVTLGILGRIATLLPFVTAAEDRYGGYSSTAKHSRPLSPKTESGTEAVTLDFRAKVDGVDELTGVTGTQIALDEQLRRALLRGAESVPIEVSVEGATERKVASFDTAFAVAKGWLAKNLNYRIPFWQLAHSAASERGSRRLLDVAEAELGRLSSKPGSMDSATCRLLLGMSLREQFPDGVVVDWSAGSPSLPPRVEATFRMQSGSGQIVAGNKIEFEVEVRNSGKGDVYQLLATASGRATGDIPILFGRIPAGKAVVRRVIVPTLETLAAGPADISLKWKERNDYVPEDAPGRLSVLAGPRPSFAVMYRVLDGNTQDSSGNGDGVVQKGESVLLRITVRNNGDRTAEGARLDLEVPKVAGLEVFGKTSVAFGDMKPGEVKESSLVVAVKQGFKNRSIDILADVGEKSPFAESKSEKIGVSIDQAVPRTRLAINRIVKTNKDVQLLDAANDEARSIAGVPADSELMGVAEFEDFIEVQYQAEGVGVRSAFLRRADVKFEVASANKGGGETLAKVTTVREYVTQPPMVIVNSPTMKTTGEAEIKLVVTAAHSEGVAGLVVRLNGQDLPEPSGEGRGIEGAKPQKAENGAKANGQVEVQFERMLALAPGENRIEIQATDVRGQKSLPKVLMITRTMRKATAAALVIGIGRYENAEISALEYAESDARAFVEFLHSEHSLVQDPENIKVLLGSKANKLSVLKALEWLTKVAPNPEDLVILYFAGHGYSEAKDTLLSCYDTEPANLKSTAIRGSELREYWGSITAQRKVLLVDACHSGGLKGAYGQNLVHSNLTDALAATGSISFYASGPAQQSWGSEELKRGIFTHSVLNGLQGAADVDGDGKVSDKELAKHLQQEVPSLAKKIGRTQNPVCEALSTGDIILTR